MSECFLAPAWRDLDRVRATAKVIVCNFWKRPEYAEQVLAYLSHCEGIENYLLLIQQDGGGEPGASAVRRICDRIQFADHRLFTASEHHGCNVNTRLGLTLGFRHSDYVIFVEDDILLAPDALRYFEWARQFESDKSIFVVSAWGRDKGWTPSSRRTKPPGNDDNVGTFSGLWIWGFATWRDRWEEMDQKWTDCTNDYNMSWDTQLHEYVIGSRFSLMPHTSRSTNIGEKDGTHRGSCLWPYWAGSPEFSGTGNFRRV